MWNRDKVRWRKLTVVIFALGVFIMLTALQRQLIYFPSKAPLDRLEVLASKINLEAWRDEDGITFVSPIIPSNYSGAEAMLQVDLTASLYRNDFFRNWRKLGKVGVLAGVSYGAYTLFGRFASRSEEVRIRVSCRPSDWLPTCFDCTTCIQRSSQKPSRMTTPTIAR